MSCPVIRMVAFLIKFYEHKNNGLLYNQILSDLIMTEIIYCWK